jgi:HSP20 family molecular chaperone IbpA
VPRRPHPALPVEDDVTASYQAGILTVSIGLNGETEAARKIEVKVEK